MKWLRRLLGMDESDRERAETLRRLEALRTHANHAVTLAEQTTRHVDFWQQAQDADRVLLGKHS